MIDSAQDTTVIRNFSVKPFSGEYSSLDSGKRKQIDEFLSDLPVKLGALASSLGIKVLLSTLSPGISGQIGVNDGKFIIKINRHEARHRQRFTLAHEIAHFLLHKDRIRESDGEWRENILLRSGQPAQVEYQANRLASDLIIPPNILIEILDKREGTVTDDTIRELSGKFGVSTAAMEVRLQVI